MCEVADTTENATLDEIDSIRTSRAAVSRYAGVQFD